MSIILVINMKCGLFYRKLLFLPHILKNYPLEARRDFSGFLFKSVNAVDLCVAYVARAANPEILSLKILP